jgi:hypothetical protein
MPTNVSAILQQALRELEAERQRVDRQISAILGVLGRDQHSTERVVRRSPRHTWSSAARAAVGRRMRAYWAKRRQEQAKTAASRSRPKSAARKNVGRASAKKKAA